MAKTEKSERVLCMLQAFVHSENVMLNRICILFKLGTYGLFLVSSRRIDLTSAVRWVYVLQCLMGVVVL